MLEGGAERSDRSNIRRVPLDLRIAAVAGRQHSLITTPQLLVLGAKRAAISHRVGMGRLYVVHRGTRWATLPSPITGVGWPLSSPSASARS